MPQMAPLSWMTLFIFFSFLFLFSMILNYYTFIYIPQMKIYSTKTKFTNWKW